MGNIDRRAAGTRRHLPGVSISRSSVPAGQLDPAAMCHSSSRSASAAWSAPPISTGHWIGWVTYEDRRMKGVTGWVVAVALEQRFDQPARRDQYEQ
jgi:hypothetical protein